MASSDSEEAENETPPQGVQPPQAAHSVATEQQRSAHSVTLKHPHPRFNTRPSVVPTTSALCETNTRLDRLSPELFIG